MRNSTSDAASGTNKIAITVEQAELQADLAKLDLIETQARETFGDEKLNIVDVAAIYGLAEKCGVLRRHAYSRLKDLGLLSYQKTDLTGSEAPDHV